ncbi:Retrovirus-related Pol polyprotein from transposon TNT 1-94 [Cucumis melo var. makuwa]|uniref:Retrovirus-related Pol polyprotein from transposon TNT 1-94 n=1 Tax=Cucumis melo var. makuwa TaxID=1194695 RepID=A0A5A7UDA8_CUCMM|nr:Retrovirus-related Pol polyprotein from transposon TNT 1-94 [Cucumis melo var. makuwa]
MSSSNTTVTEEGADVTIRASSSTTPQIMNPLFEQWDLWDAMQDFFGVQSRAEEDFLRKCFRQQGKVLQDLDEVYNPVITVIQGKSDIFWLDMQFPSNGQRNHSNQNFHGYNRQYFSGQRGNLNNGQGRGNKPTCQVCGKYGHSALVCYNRFNKEFSSPLVQDRNEHSSNGSVNPNAAVFVSTQNVTPFTTPNTVADPNWYIDSGATNHVTR